MNYIKGSVTKFHLGCIVFVCSVSELPSVEEISMETGCLPQYISKGLAMACFYYARCLTLGRGVQKDMEEAQKYYSLVCSFFYF